VAGRWRVSAAADRVGVRLDGPALSSPIAGETVTLGVTWGAIQVPPDGRPIVLSADHQTTGGYRVPAVVISADRSGLGQLRPGDAVGFELVDRETALSALRAQREALAVGGRALREATGWHALVEAAGG
jgi:allophanate hydrolase subunit 2